MHLCQNSPFFAFLRRFCLILNKRDTKSFSGNDYIDKIKIIIKYGGVSIGSSWLTKTFIGVFFKQKLRKKAENGLF